MTRLFNWPVELFEWAILRPWNIAHDKWPTNDCLDGNTGDGKAWVPRKGVAVYAILLVTIFMAAILVSIAISRHPSLGPPTAARDFVQVCVLLAVLLNTAYAYSNYVTTNRSELWRGPHKGYRDVIIVNLAVPVLAVWSHLAAPGRLFIDWDGASGDNGRGRHPSRDPTYSGIPAEDMMLRLSPSPAFHASTQRLVSARLQ